MVIKDSRVDTVSDALKQLSGLCDRGFALAVHIRLIRPTLLFQTYSVAWSEHYSLKGYMLTDPTVRWGLEHTGSASWHDLQDQDQAGVFADAKDFGLEHGITYATGPAASRTIASGATAGVAFSDQQVAEIGRTVDAIHNATDGFDQFPAALQQALRNLGHRG